MTVSYTHLMIIAVPAFAVIYDLISRAVHRSLRLRTVSYTHLDLDLVLGNDITTPVAVNEMKKMDNQTVFNHDKIALVMDHFIPNKDIKSAENCKCCREFACRHDITNYFDVGEMGIEHALLPEKGLVVAGDAVIGADSHTCTSVSYTHLDMYKRQDPDCAGGCKQRG